MKKTFCTLIILILIFISAQAFALTDSEYRVMMKNPDFAQADNELNSTWKRISRTLSGSVLERLKEEQHEWLRTTRDNEADNLIEEGFSRSEAYAEATQKRVHELLKAEFLYAPAKGLQTFYKHRDSDTWIKVRILNRKTMETECKFFLLWTDGSDKQAMTALSGRGRIRNGVFTFSDKKYDGFTVTIVFRRDDDTVEVTANDSARFHIGTDDPFEGPYHKFSAELQLSQTQN